MDNNARNRYELHQAVTNWVSNVMTQNQIPACMMEDALVDVLGKVREVAFQDYINQLLMEHEQEMAKQAEQANHMPEQSEPVQSVPQVPEVGKQALERQKNKEV